VRHVSWETEEKESGWTRREWLKVGIGAASIGVFAGLGGLVSGQILPPPYKIPGEIRETIQYTKFPTPQWWNAKAGTPVRVSDFKEWQGATGAWRGLYQGTTYVAGTGFPCLIIRIKRETGPNPFFTVPAEDQLPPNFKELVATDPAFHLFFDDPNLDPSNGGTRIIVLFDRCVHLCCYPGWHVVDNPPPARDYSTYGATPPTYEQFKQDPIYCVCHGSQYDPMLLTVNVNDKNGKPYVGATRVHGPAPRALPVIPVKAQGENLVGGMPIDPASKQADAAWFTYC
jgi:Rieske Fe-S protein